MTPFDVLAGTLDELAQVIRRLTADQFTRRDWRSSGSVGGHVRHCLDHVDALLQATVSGVCCYDTRVRGTAVEDDPALAAARLAACRSRLERLDPGLLPRPLALSARLCRDGFELRTATTIAREVAFVLSHTVHHAALIAVLMEAQGEAMPAHFGLAPTSPAREAACAR